MTKLTAKLTGRELFELAPMGAKVTFSDGTPEPPARHKIKLREWKTRNATGVFYGWDPKSPDPKHAAWSRDTITIRTADTGYMTINRIMGADVPWTFEVEPPAPGTIIALSTFHRGGGEEARHVWASDAAAYAWSLQNGYDLTKQSYRYERVGADGSREPWTPKSTGTGAQELTADSFPPI